MLLLRLLLRRCRWFPLLMLLLVAAAGCSFRDSFSLLPLARRVACMRAGHHDDDFIPILREGVRVKAGTPGGVRTSNNFGLLRK